MKELFELLYGWWSRLPRWKRLAVWWLSLALSLFCIQITRVDLSRVRPLLTPTHCLRLFAMAAVALLVPAVVSLVGMMGSVCAKKAWRFLWAPFAAAGAMYAVFLAIAARTYFLA